MVEVVELVAAVDVEVLEGLEGKWGSEILHTVMIMRAKANLVIYNIALIVASGGHIAFTGESLASFLQYALHVLSLSLNSQLQMFLDL